jgi:hypothetical protein
MARCRPRVPKVVMIHGKVCEDPLHLRKEEARASEVKKRLKETRLGVGSWWATQATSTET